MGFRIKEIRMEEGMSQEELSKKSGVSRATISGLESGRIEVTSTKTLNKLADAMGRKITEIFCAQSS